jgi:hypothetical protein
MKRRSSVETNELARVNVGVRIHIKHFNRNGTIPRLVMCLVQHRKAKSAVILTGIIHFGVLEESLIEQLAEDT